MDFIYTIFIIEFDNLRGHQKSLLNFLWFLSKSFWKICRNIHMFNFEKEKKRERVHI